MAFYNNGSHRCLTGSKYASGSLDAPCEMVPLNSFVLQYLCHNQFVS